MFKPTLTFSGFTMFTSLVKTKVTSKKVLTNRSDITEKACCTSHIPPQIYQSGGKFNKAFSPVIFEYYIAS